MQVINFLCSNLSAYDQTFYHWVHGRSLELEAWSTESGWVHFTIIDHVCFIDSN